jgi:hypothetical protein
MAYRDPEQLTCPSCAKRAELVWVVGTGPNTKPGKGAASVQILDPGPLAETENRHRPRVARHPDRPHLWRNRIDQALTRAKGDLTNGKL